MLFPNTENKHLYDPFFSPSDYIKYMRENGLLPDFKIPNGVLFIYSKKLQDKLIGDKEVEKIELFKGDFFILKNSQVGILNVGIGAPAVVTAMDNLAIIKNNKKVLEIVEGFYKDFDKLL